MTDESGPPPAPAAPTRPATTPGAPARSAPAVPGPADGGTDWTDQVTDLIVDTVDKVRTRTTGPILEVARASVYAVVAVVLLLPVLVLATAGTVRLLNWALPGDVWVAYAVLSALLLLVGSLLWSKRQPTTRPGGAP